jgi:predicted MFS family arabinose efflux permease
MKQMSNAPNLENGIMQRPAPVHRASLLPIVLLSAAGFTVMTTEFIIVGLLPSMAADLGVSVSQAGLLVTLFALTVAAAGPFLTARLIGYERKKLAIGQIALVPFIKESFVLALVLVVLGICQAALFTVSHTRVMKATEGRAALGASFNISGCNIGIALGAFIGNRVIDLLGLASVGLAGTIIVVAAMAATLSLAKAPRRVLQPS